MVSDGVLEYVSSVEFLKNDTIGLRWTHKYTSIILPQSWSDSESKTYTMVSRPALYTNQTLVVEKLFISNENHNQNNSIFNAQIWQTIVAVWIGEINYQG